MIPRFLLSVGKSFNSVENFEFLVFSDNSLSLSEVEITIANLQSAYKPISERKMIFFEIFSFLLVFYLFFPYLCFCEQLFVLLEVIDFELDFTFLDWNAFLHPYYLSIVHFCSLAKLVKHFFLNFITLHFKKLSTHFKSFIRFKSFCIKNHLLF